MRAALDASYDALEVGLGRGLFGQRLTAVVQANLLTRTCMLAEVLPKVSHAVQLEGSNQLLLVSRLRGCFYHHS